MRGRASSARRSGNVRAPVAANVTARERIPAPKRVTHARAVAQRMARDVREQKGECACGNHELIGVIACGGSR